MRNRRILSITVALFLLASAFFGMAAVAAAEEPVPVIPASYFGQVFEGSYGGQVVADGATVEVYLEGDTEYRGKPRQVKDGWYGQAGLAEQYVVSGTAEDLGKVVIFKVNGIVAETYVDETKTTVTYKDGDTLRVDLVIPDTTPPVMKREKPDILQGLPYEAAQYTGDIVFEWSADEDLDTGAQPEATFAAEGVENVEGTVTIPDERTVRVVPAADLLPGTTYTLTVTGIKDKEGNEAEAVRVQFGTTSQVTLPEGELSEALSLAFSGGNVVVTLPEGTVAASGASLEAWTVSEPPAVPASLKVAGQVVDITAQGITLPQDKGFQIKLRANADARNPAIYYFNEADGVWEAVPASGFDPESGFVTAEVGHLSIYGVLEPAVTLEQLVVEPSELDLTVGETRELEVRAVYSDGTEADVTGEASYASEKESVATVSATGLVTAVGEGETVVTATYGDKSAQITVSVSAAPLPPSQDTTPPVVASTDPANDATNVPVNKTITVTFNEDVQAGGAYDSISVKNAAGNTVAVTKSISGKVLTIRPDTYFAYSTRYTVAIPAGAVKDMAGNALANEYAFSFTTQAASGGGGGGGGGRGGGSTSVNRVEKAVSATSNTVAEIADRVRVEIPAGAVTGTNPSLVAELLSDSKAQGAGMSLISRVVDISLKNGTLDGQITIVLYYDKGKLGSNEEPVAFYYDEDKAQWVRLDGTVDSTKGTVTVTVDHLTMFAVFAVAKQEEQPQPPQPTPVVTFKDMAGHWAEATVVKLAGMGVIGGYEDGTFRPNNKITRAEITSILVRALKLQPADDSALKFVDNSAIPDWARGAVAAAIKEGLVRGYPVQSGVAFKAASPVTRAELVAILSRVLEDRLGKITGQPVQFADAAKIPAWAKDAVNTAAAAGVVGGYQDGTFRAQNNVTRAEAASMILRLLEKIE